MRSRRTKIVCTIGPSVSDPQMLRKLVESGMDVARLNFSHGSHAEFSVIIKSLRSLELELGRPVGIMADIQGPKMRVGKLHSGQLDLKPGSEVMIISDQNGNQISSKLPIIPASYKEFCKDVGPGNTILLDDGLIEIRVIERTDQGLRAEVVNGGILKENKGINVPDVAFSAHSITEKDYSDILFCVKEGVDFIALSFVRTDQEVRHLKNFIESRGKRIQVISKIEKREALNHLEEIINASDGILIARGDLAVEVGNERVPVLQKQIVRECNLHAKTVIIATQMLMSMVSNPRPSRAEASDVANAIVDGTDAVMLSNETAVGQYPIQSLEMMNRIVLEMEQEIGISPIPYNEWKLGYESHLAMAILQTAVRLATVLQAKYIVVVTESGNSGNLVSKCRPKNKILAITGSERAARQLALRWGVDVILMEDMEGLIARTAVFEAIGQRLLALNVCGSGDKIVITAGLPALAHGSTNTIKVQNI